MKKPWLLIFMIIFLFIACCIQQYQIQTYKESEKEWLRLQNLWREKMDTCMNRNERIYEQLYQFQDIRVKQLKAQKGEEV